MSFVVAIDGPAGSGKGTVTKLVGDKLNLINIDTGATYRCVALETLNQHILLDEKEKIVSILDDIEIEFVNTDEGKKVFLNGNDVTTKIRSKEVSQIVAQVSSIIEVRLKMVDLQRRLAEGKNVIMEGRDIGTYVFPNADVKIYLDASAEERANRRFKQNQEAGIEMDYEEILKNIKMRDEIDKNKEMGALKQAEDAIYLDSTHLTIEQVVEKIIEIIKEKGFEG
ncbi:MAG: (d)CMP kinase [Clostridia bacterium]|nr:(d)CMP kinase [Clostridia bacterium]